MSQVERGSLGEQHEVPIPPTYTLANVPGGNSPDWKSYRKKVATRMMRIDGPFLCETLEGPVKCENGFLAIDQAGYPYPVDVNVHVSSYEEIEEEDEPSS